MRARNKNSALALRLLAIVVFMVGLSFAAVPLYNLFCKVTGFGGTTSTADAGSDVILNETISIRFDASIDPSMGWEFRPAQGAMDLRIGETGLAFYEAYNPTDRPIAGQAVYNVTPFSAGGYFTKIDCFCFTEQLLMPGERVMMPVTFFVDPEIVTDAEGKFVREITLSYAFGEIELTEEMRLRIAEAAQNDENVPIN
ncbi:cytochrome c oxidase assembly protein [Abyssibius alkaniclasticus]|uniref:cytochrome c oxidase assembly protein n=1 Tax=Abyssibius alkaniclasticus TaxID=2881234 RepID=UPI0023649BC6|nr:cytochrome c oxidase assembly protein [Abyssibius alkaniclasticus]UPH72438.1 cytochrome c oxidase assembly protein [Abyssibius alkaniclasticus]